MAMGANFGAKHNLVRNTRRGTVLGWNQFPEVGGNDFTGGARDRFLYYTISRENAAVVAAYEDAVDRLLDKLAD